MSADPSLRPLGLTVPLDGVRLLEHAELASEWASLGYTDLWSSEGNAADAFTPLTVAAPSGLRLGTAIVPATTRGPALLAQCAASLAEIAPGRFTLGVGAASKHIVQQWNAIAYERPLQRMRDTLHFLADAFDGALIDRDYGSFRVEGFRLGLLPEQRPRIVIAALRERMLRLAGTEADGAIVTWLTSEDVATVAPLVRAGGADKTIVARIWVAPTDDVDAAHHLGRRMAATFLCGPALRASHSWLGRADKLAETWTRWDAGDRKAAAAAIPEDLLDDLVVHGSAEAIHRRVDEYRAAGVDVPVLALLPVAGVDLLHAVRDLAPKRAGAGEAIPLSVRSLRAGR